jgi:hypothetical protein
MHRVFTKSRKKERVFSEHHKPIESPELSLYDRQDAKKVFRGNILRELPRLIRGWIISSYCCRSSRKISRKSKRGVNDEAGKAHERRARGAHALTTLHQNENVPFLFRHQVHDRCVGR